MKLYPSKYYFGLDLSFGALGVEEGNLMCKSVRTQANTTCLQVSTTCWLGFPPTIWMMAKHDVFASQHSMLGQHGLSTLTLILSLTKFDLKGVLRYFEWCLRIGYCFDVRLS